VTGFFPVKKYDPAAGVPRATRTPNCPNRLSVRISRAEWHGTSERFAALGDNRDGQFDQE